MNWNIFNPDRRLVYLLLLVALTVPLLRPIGLPIPISQETLLAYDYIESLDPDARVLMSFDHGPGVAADLSPAALAMMRHLAMNDIKTYIMTTVVDGERMTAQFIEEVFSPTDQTYGEDYVFLGYLAGEESGLAALSDSIIETLQTDSYGTPLATLPIMAGVEKLSDIDLVIAMNGSSVEPWIRQAYTRNDVPIIFVVLAVMGPRVVPFVQSGQVVSVFPGARGGAEYESVTGIPGTAIATMDAQSMGHLLIIAFIVLGNIGYYMNRKS